MNQIKMLEKLNAAIQKIANESGSEMVQNLKMVREFSSRQPGCIFKGVVDCWAPFCASGAEITMDTKDGPDYLDKMLKVRIQDSLLAIMNLAQSELEKLGMKVEVRI